jgi:hypothetical protein
VICAATRLDGEPCKAKAVAGGTTCPFHSSDVKLGEPSKLSDELVEKLLGLIRAGNYVSTAVRAVGISRPLFYQWLDRGQSSAEIDAPFREFRESVEHARAEAEARAVTQIANAARESWQAAAWLLERQYPDRWGRASVRARDEAAIEPVERVDVDDPFREVDELADRRRTRTG